jgi:hypothetical protein
MSPELEAFLRAEDLDDVLKARQRIGALEKDDVAAVRSILEQWQNRQAVSNLLFHPHLIPGDIRFDFVLRGLAEREIAYYVLAAVAGLAGIDPVDLTGEQRERVAIELLALIEMTDNVIARRASVSFNRFVNESEAPRVFALLGHRDGTVRHNVRAWLFRRFKDRGEVAFAKVARESGLSDETARRVIAEFKTFVTESPDGISSLAFPLYAYIPNLRDAERPV